MTNLHRMGDPGVESQGQTTPADGVVATKGTDVPADGTETLERSAFPAQTPHESMSTPPVLAFIATLARRKAAERKIQNDTADAMNGRCRPDCKRPDSLAWPVGEEWQCSKCGWAWAINETVREWYVVVPEWLS